MVKVLSVYKSIGITPNQLIEELRSKKKEYSKVKIGIAGRLDPMAHGVLLLMVGEENKNRAKYLDSSKVYEFQVLFGVATDTYDAFGILSNETIEQFSNLVIDSKNLEKKIKQFIKEKTGKQIQVYPPYSSKTVNGKALFQWARENRLSEIKIPKREIEIFSFDLVKIEQIPIDKIKKRILENINSVVGDFRQVEIIKKWNNLFKSEKKELLTVASFKIHVSSGTYVRSIASELGEKIGSGAIALDILRTKVGEYTLDDSIRL